jgi:dynein heavy chain
VTLKYIVTRVCEWGFNDYVDKVQFVSKSLPSLCYSIFSKVGRTFLPLPRKSHYLFNLRDLMKVL